MNITFEQLGLWVAIALIFVDVYLRWRTASRSEEPQKRIVQMGTEFVSKKDLGILDQRLGRVETSIDEIHQEMKEDRAILMQTDEMRASEIHKRINQLSQEFNDKFQAVPHEITAMLRNIGVIK